MIKRRILALAVTALCGLPSVSAWATTQVEFDLINLRDPMDDNTVITGDSYSITTSPLGETYGFISGSIILEFQGDGTSIENGAVSVVGGSIYSEGVTEAPNIIKVTVAITSSLFDGDNDDVGTLSGWNGSAGTITWITVMRSWPDDSWPGEGTNEEDPNFPDGPDTPRLDTLGLKVVNNGTLGCVGTLCGNLGTPPDGVVREFVNHAGGWAEPLNTTTVTFDNGFASPFAISFSKFIIGYDPNNPANKSQEMIFETEGQTVPEPGAGASTAAALAALAFLQRRRSHKA